MDFTIQAAHGSSGNYAFRSASAAHDDVNARADDGRGNAGGEIAVSNQADARSSAADVIDQFFMARAIQHDYHQIGNVAAQTARNSFQVFFYRRGKITT